MIHLALTDFAAVTPGVVSPDGWKSWAATGVKPGQEVVPACPVPAMMKRRMTPLGRLALTALPPPGVTTAARTRCLPT